MYIELNDDVIKYCEYLILFILEIFIFEVEILIDTTLDETKTVLNVENNMYG